MSILWIVAGYVGIGFVVAILLSMVEKENIFEEPGAAAGAIFLWPLAVVMACWGKLCELLARVKW